jgi:hypothetical protein
MRIDTAARSSRPNCGEGHNIEVFEHWGCEATNARSHSRGCDLGFLPPRLHLIDVTRLLHHQATQRKRNTLPNQYTLSIYLYAFFPLAILPSKGLSTGILPREGAKQERYRLFVYCTLGGRI